MTVVLGICIGAFVLAGILFLIKAFEVKSGRTVVPSKVRGAMDSVAHVLTDRVGYGFKKIGALIFHGISNAFMFVYGQGKCVVRWFERHIGRLYRYIRGQVDVNHRGKPSDFIESVKGYKEEE